MRGSKLFCLALISIITAACGPMQSTRPTSTPLTLPSPTPFVVVRAASATAQASTASPVPPTLSPPTPAPSQMSRPTETLTAHSPAGPAPTGKLAREDAPIAISAALRSAGISARVYWFTFDAGDREEALMVQYDSPIINRPGYHDMLQAVKAVAAQSFLRIDPPLHSVFIAATDLTGTSDTVVRLRRSTVERWTNGEIGDADLFNNGFEPARVVITCTAGGCTALMATPYPTFPAFPFPFPTPTP